MWEGLRTNHEAAHQFREIQHSEHSKGASRLPEEGTRSPAPTASLLLLLPLLQRLYPRALADLPLSLRLYLHLLLPALYASSCGQ